MRWMKALVFLAISTMAFPIAAQIHRCQDAAGKFAYSDRPCESGQSGQLIERQKTPEQILEERLQAAEANERKYRAQSVERERLTLEKQKNPAPIVVNLPAPQNLATSRGCKEATKNLEFVGSLPSGKEKYMRYQAALKRVDVSCGTKTKKEQAPPEGFTKEEQEPPEGFVPPSAARPTPPSVMTHCNSGFCYDNQGGVYHKAGPNFMTGPNGQACHGNGATWNCN